MPPHNNMLWREARCHVTHDCVWHNLSIHICATPQQHTVVWGTLPPRPFTPAIFATSGEGKGWACVCVRTCMCLFVCLCISMHIYSHTHVHTHRKILPRRRGGYVCVCVRVCAAKVAEHNFFVLLVAEDNFHNFSFKSLVVRRKICHLHPLRHACTTTHIQTRTHTHKYEQAKAHAHT